MKINTQLYGGRSLFSSKVIQVGQRNILNLNLNMKTI